MIEKEPAAAEMSLLLVMPEAGGAVFFYPPSLSGYKRKTPDARAEESFEQSEIRIIRT